MRKRESASLACALLSLILLLTVQARAADFEDDVEDVPEYAPLWYVDGISLYSNMHGARHD